MARPTNGTLTGAGFTQLSGTTKYTKTQGTALAAVDIGNGNAGTGVVEVKAAAAGTPVVAADFNTHLTTLQGLGVSIGVPPSCDQSGHLVSYSITI